MSFVPKYLPIANLDLVYKAVAALKELVKNVNSKTPFDIPETSRVCLKDFHRFLSDGTQTTGFTVALKAVPQDDTPLSDAARPNASSIVRQLLKQYCEEFLRQNQTLTGILSTEWIDQQVKKYSEAYRARLEQFTATLKKVQEFLPNLIDSSR